MTFDKTLLLTTYQGKEISFIVDDLDKTLVSLDSTFERIKGQRDNESLCNLQEYRKQVDGLLYFLTTGIKPIDLTKDDLNFFKPLVEDLIDRGQLDGNILGSL